VQAFRNYEVTQHTTAAQHQARCRLAPGANDWPVVFSTKGFQMVSNRGRGGLTVKRHEEQAVRIKTASGEVIRVTVVRVGDGWAQVNFLAPDSVRILRDELEDMQP
jgi:sRNA-binding carbon storage regulator CsrA